jgi:hypothetical protein
MLEFTPQEARTVPFDELDYLVRRHGRIGRYKKMQMVWHYVQRKYLDLEFLRRFADDFFEPVLDIAYKDRPAPFRTPHEVVVHQVHMMLSMFVFHVDSLTEQTTYVKNYFAIHLLNKFRSFLA